MIYIKFTTILCNPSNFSTLVVYRERNSNIEQFVEYIVYLAITKYIDLMLGDFNEDSISEGTIEISLQSVGFCQLVLGARHIRGASLDHI